MSVVCEQIRDLVLDGGDDGRSEQGVKAREEQSADDDRDQNLHTGVHVPFGTGVFDDRLGAHGEGFDLLLDFVNEFLHVDYLFSLLFFCGRRMVLISSDIEGFDVCDCNGAIWKIFLDKFERTLSFPAVTENEDTFVAQILNYIVFHRLWSILRCSSGILFSGLK